MYNEWAQKVDDESRIGLERSLLVRDSVVLHLSVNFDAKVSSLFSFNCHLAKIKVIRK